MQMATPIFIATKHVVYLTRQCQIYWTISREMLHRTEFIPDPTESMSSISERSIILANNE